ncbi:MAG: YgiQ family radical SAM protein [Deltaproteobacteria bacterium]|nr:YgiQ family radical SAM protein [Deltaproteobacteria bacterium]
MFIPTTKQELKTLGWNKLDIIIVSGDSYIDNPFIGAAVIGKLLISKGFKTGIIGQPAINSNADITRLGEPKLFWGITGGCIDSMVANYTASGKKRKKDDYTAGGLNNKRPDRAVIVYANLIRQHFKNTQPLILGGIEASLRRIPHYDYMSNKLRRSILFDAKADYIIYGMGEKAVIALAEKLQKKENTKNIAGTCCISAKHKKEYIQLPSYENILKDKKTFIQMFNTFYSNNDSKTAKGLCQKNGDRYLIHNPPADNLTTEELDKIYDLNYENDLHPFHKQKGDAPALNTIKFSVKTHRGCYGECAFCAIAIHEGKTVISRSEESIIKQVKKLTIHPDFKGYILDAGGPTANMYGFECKKKIINGACKDKKCLYPKICPSLNPSHKKQIDLLKKLEKIKGIKKIFIASGIRHDLILADKKYGEKYLKQIIKNHISGQMKIAPEHIEDKILALIGKPNKQCLIDFVNLFYKYTKQAQKKLYLTYYFMAALPACAENDMKKLKTFISSKLKTNPEQIQIFTPTPSTYATLSYYTEINPFTKNKIYVEKNIKKKEKQKSIIISKRRMKK